MVILFYVLHVIGFGGDGSGVGRGELLQSWGTSQASRVGRSSEGVRPHGVGSSGEWGRVSPGPEPQQIGGACAGREGCEGAPHLNHLRTCVRVCRCAELRTCADVQGPGRVQMCKGSDVQGWGNVQACKGLEMCRTSGVCKCVGFRECASVV